jgi:hypothetical protein
MDIISSQMVIRIGNLKESDEKYVQCLDSGFSESSHVFTSISALLNNFVASTTKVTGVCTRNIAHL